MKSDVILYRPVAWSVLPLHLFVCLVFIVLLAMLGMPIELSLIAGFLVYMTMVLSLRLFLTRTHRAGIKQMKASQYEEAIHAFEKSYAFFTRHVWLDKYRYWLLYSSSRLSNREAALCSKAYCLLQQGHVSEAKRVYEQTLADFPESALAHHSLRTIEAIQNPKD